ncbi:MAG: peroxide stress protein YaaA [Gammaproteobacteria bacterium]|nr:peroxide stress protein YaaA [Gammaproteobacteria bacterium]
MLVTLSPAKTLDFDTPLKVSRHTVPELVDDATALAEIMRGKRPRDLRALMGISDKLAELNAARFHDWSPAGGAGSRQAVLAFMGDVYTGLDAQSLGARDLDWAQKHLRILSGLYGVLRPLDLIRPYRLEMGTALATPRGKNLYQFWGEAPTRALNAQARGLRTRWLVNLASQEYFGVVDAKALEPAVVTPVFKDFSNGRYKVVSFFAKKARGLMTRFIIENRLRKPDDLLAFDREGYRYDPAESTTDAPVFKRRTA